MKAEKDMREHFFSVGWTVLYTKETAKAGAHIFFFLNESAAIMSISFDFGAIIIFLFGLIF